MALLKITEGAEDCDLAIVKVTASWCGPCKKIHPEFLRLCNEHSTISSYVLDLEAAQREGGEALRLLDSLDVDALPAFVGFARGRELSRAKGADPSNLALLFKTLAASAVSAQASEPPPLEIHDAK
jgi:thioredoxin 1